MNEIHSTQQGFSNLGIAPALLNILDTMKFASPTPIQTQAIPVGVQGKDLVGIAQTGTGKTLAYGIPMIQRVLAENKQGLVVVPTRELALQVSESLHAMGRRLGLRVTVLIGGTPMYPQIRSLKADPHIVIATPGRLLDHAQQRTLRLDRFDIAVLDEADKMMDMGFLPNIKTIFAHLPQERQTMFFSATMPPEIMKLASAYMKIPVRIEIAPTGTTSENVSQEVFVVSRDQKTALLSKVLESRQGSALVFTRTKYGATKVMRQLRDLGIAAADIHSNRTLNQRIAALEGFKTGRYRVLVATDIASRGIDVTGVELVVNYDLPSTSEDYVHRIGRTARAGAQGHAVTFAMPDERYGIRSIERLIRKTLPISPVPELPHLPPPAYVPKESSPRPYARREQGSRRGYGGGQRGSRSY